MKIILVDDEQWIVTGLARIIGKRYPQHQLLCFTDPCEACAEIARALPDLLITDIRMEQMDGLTLIAKAKALGLQACAVLTGLEEVPLLQEAIRLQVKDYLIKPVNKSELYALVERVEVQLRQQDARAREALEEQLRLCAEYGECPADAALRRYAGHTLALAPGDAQAAPGENMTAAAVRLEAQGRVLYLIRPECAQAAEAWAQGVPGARVFPLEPDALHDALRPASGTDALREAAQACLSGEDDVRAASAVRALLQDGDAPELMLALCRACDRAACFWTACELAAQALRGGEEAAAVPARLRALPAAAHPRVKAVQDVAEWMERHYAEDITLAEASSMVYLQANYLTTLFKKEMSVGFVHYLNLCRVDAACRAIRASRDDALSDIAQRAGFASPRHFFTIFKRFTGQTPGEFRQALVRDGFANR